MASLLSEKKVFEWLDSHRDSTTKYVEKWLLTHPNAAKRTRVSSIQHNASSHLFQALGQTEETRLLKHRISSPNFPSNRRRKSIQELRQLNRQELFMELLTDVVSPDFDVNHLSHKILANVLVLVNGDRSSLFLVEGTDEHPVLVSRLFDVMENTSVEDAIHDENDALKIPFGVGIIGCAAKMGVTINLKDAYKDPRFNADIDRVTGYKTKSILCMPIKTSDGQVIGVAQVINKKGEHGVFSKQDEEDFQTYLTFCAIGLINAQLLDHSFSLSRRLQVLLQLTEGLFEDTTSLEVVMGKVIHQSLELIPSEKCAVLLVDQQDSKEEEVKFGRAFQVDHPTVTVQSLTSVKTQDLSSITDLAVATQVAKTGKPMIVTHERLGGHSQSASLLLGKDTNSVLCMPIVNKDGQTIGVAQLVNKLTGLPFNQLDVGTFEVFVTFCGLGLHNVLMYEKISIVNARHKVALEVLSYHASASPFEAEKFVNVPIPEAEVYHLPSYSFDDLPLSDDHTVLASVRMFMDSGFISQFKIDVKTLYRWVLTVKRNYRPVIYHNWRHAFNVAQTMFAMYMHGDLANELTDCDKLALLVACFCHDLDHRGTNNTFQVKSANPLATLYSTSTMEHHHLDHCIMILNSEGNQIFNGLTSKQYDEVVKMIGNAILSTDLALYFKKRNGFIDIVDNRTFSWNEPSHKELLRGMMMTACDVSAITKPWPIQMRVAEMVANEFFEQGDVEREKLHSEPVAMMDRCKKDQLPSMQVGFINFVCLPLYEELAKFNTELQPLLDGVMSNKRNWQYLADKPNEPESVPCDDVQVPKPKPEVCEPISRARKNSGTGNPIRGRGFEVAPAHKDDENQERMSTPVREAWRSQTDVTQQTGNRKEPSNKKEEPTKQKLGKCILN